MEITFLFKKIISAVLLPIPWIILCLALGLALLWFTRLQALGRVFTTLGLLILLISALPFAPNYLLKSLESRYSPLTTAPLHVAYVVVLSGGYQPDKQLPVTSLLRGATLSRLVEGIRLYRSAPGARLLLSGGSVFSDTAEALIMQKVAVALGVPPQDIVVDTTSKDTHDQAATLQAMLGDNPFILVTSAFHMPRAMGLFERLQMHPIAAPTGYYVFSGSLTPAQMISPRNIDKMDLAIHEYLGMWWEKL